VDGLKPLRLLWLIPNMRVVGPGLAGVNLPIFVLKATTFLSCHRKDFCDRLLIGLNSLQAMARSSAVSSPEPAEHSRRRKSLVKEKKSSKRRSPSPSESEIESVSSEPEPEVVPKKKSKDKSKSKAQKDKGKFEGTDPFWVYKPPKGATLHDKFADYKDFDWDALNDDPEYKDCELVLIRVPEGVRLFLV
jgi:hypothetical protein